MNRTYKRVLKTMALIMAPTILLAACGPNQSEEKKNDKGQLVVTIGQQTLDNSKLPQGDSYENNAYRRLIEKEMNVDLKSEFEANGEEYDRQVSLAIASGEIPDIMVVNHDQLVELAQNDLIEDLSDIYKKKASKYIKSIYDSFDDVPLKAATVDGKLMAIPGTANDFGPNLVWIRQDWLDKLGITLDKDGNHAISLDELESTAKAFIEKNPGGAQKTQGLAFANYLNADNHGNTGYTATAIMNAFNAYPKVYMGNQSGVTYGSNTPEMKEGLGYLRRLYNEGVIDKQFGTRTYDDITAMVVNNELGIVPGPWHIPDWNLVQVRTAHPEADFTPYALEDKEGHINAVQKTGVGGFIVVRKGFSKPELVMDMVNLIYDKVRHSENMEKEYPEIYEYQKIGVDGSVRPTNIELFKNLSEISDAQEAVDGSNGTIDIAKIEDFGIQEMAKTIKEYKEDPAKAAPNKWASYVTRDKAIVGVMGNVRKLDSYREEHPLAIFDTLEAAKRNGAQLEKLEQEMFIQYVTGQASLDTFNDYVKKWNDQGGADILKEIQALQKK